MHDATECGIWGGLYEMARAGQYGIKVEQDLIVTQEVIVKTCKHFEIDPYSTISEGTLIAIVDPKETEGLVSEFTKNNILSSIVGEVTREKNGLKITEGGRTFDLKHPKTDPYWAIMEKLST